ncbi:unnamed protein product [Zymoseptoria tritici ST99CH_1A5]|uniref:Mitochondrial thiamine pyrophosphate carrier 1 n=1 Tax=Zymoseptoria tritici ST99CH_1A5 TaxID=1276529 RepID=A0A1Y6LF37_ZYMTR|nr:unnamed protein product [Zymoseptoria tritici ST99CH_1A5]
MADTKTTTVLPKLPLPLPQVKKSQNITPLQSLLAGSIAGSVEASITYPFEFAKTRAQLKVHSNLPTASPFRLLQQTVSSEGLAGLYTGCGALVIGTALKAGVRFTTFDAIRNALADEQGRLSSARGVFAGMLAGATESVIAVTPTERIKTALIDDAKGAKRFRSTMHGISILIQEQGIAGIYRGLVSTTAKQAGTSAVRMGAYNAMRSQYQTRYGTAPVRVYETFAMGAIAGVATVYATQPLDTIKTRSQSARGERLLDAIVGTWRDGGVKGFWRGSTMRLSRLVLSGGIVFAVYEQISSLMRLG